MIRVMILATDLERGGLPLRLLRLAPTLRACGVEPIIGCLARPGPVSGELQRAGFETFSCDAVGRFDVSCLRRLASHVRRVNPDVLHGALFHANLAVRLVGRLDRARPVVTTTVTIEIERRWHRWVESMTAGLSDVHVANSRAVAEHLVGELGFPADRVVVIPNAVDAARIASAPLIDRAAWGISDDEALVIWVGRMDPVKNLHTLIEGIGMVKQARRVVAVLIGDGPERGRVERQIARCHLEDTVRLVGWRADAASWMRSADALVLTSRTEGSPNVVLEAIAAGCPVVASDLPSCRELIVDSSLGQLCRVGDAGDFARGLATVLTAGRRSLDGESRCRLMERHDLCAIGRLWRGVYEMAMSHS